MSSSADSSATDAVGLSDLSDDALMAQVQAGDESAFSEIYSRFSKRTFHVARLICRDPGRAEDTVQDAFLSLWRTRASYQADRGSVSAWLMSLTRHRAIDVARSNSTHAARRSAEETLASLPTPSIAGADLDQERHLHLLLAALPDAQREVIVLAFYGQLTHDEIAGHLGLPPGTVKGRMRLGLKKLGADAQLQDSMRG